MFPGRPPMLRAVFRRGRALLLVAVTLILVVLFYRQALPQLPGRIQEALVLGSKQHPGHHNQAQNNAEKELPVPSVRNPNARPRSFAAGTPKPPGEQYTKALIMAKTKREDGSWIHEPFQYSSDEEKGPLSVSDEWDSFLYTTDDINEQFHTPVNKGREVMAYLTYIVDNYNHLPDVSVFMHAHRSSWHDNYFGLNAPAMLRRLNLDHVMRLGYVNLRCQWKPGCPDHIHPANTELNDRKPEEAAFAQAWKELFPQTSVPKVLSQPCCAQFALTADRIRVLPLAQYVKLRDWILTTELEDSISGRVFEYIYQYLWTGSAVLCPSEHECYCRVYGICFKTGGRGLDAYVTNKFKRKWFVKMLDQVTGAVHRVLGIADNTKPLEEPTFVFWDEQKRQKEKQIKNYGEQSRSSRKQGLVIDPGESLRKEMHRRGRGREKKQNWSETEQPEQLDNR